MSIMTESINDQCKSCHQFQENMEDGDKKGLCGFCIGLAHWQDAKNWVRDGANCPYFNMNDYEAQKRYMGIK